MGPEAGDVEISLIGPGFGESALIHVGDGRWIIVDSCIESGSNKCAALQYLKEIGADLSLVLLIVATHWHDDHIRGLSEILAECPNAKFCTSSILTEREFIASVIGYELGSMGKVGSGVRELSRILLMRKSGPAITLATADKRILNIAAGTLSHGLQVEAWALSPGDGAIRRYMLSLGRHLTKQGGRRKRFPSISPNDCSVVLWISIGNVSILLGADLEESSGGNLGWTAILSSTCRPQGVANVFKVPHHGSENGHHPGVWQAMIADDVVCLLAPFNRMPKLPRQSDVDRLLQHASTAFSTAKMAMAAKPKRDASVTKLVSDLKIPLERIQRSAGRVTLRADASEALPIFRPELVNGALPLVDMYSTKGGKDRH